MKNGKMNSGLSRKQVVSLDELEVRMKLLFVDDDPLDGHSEIPVCVKEIFADHALAYCEDITYWIDETNMDMFLHT